MSNNRERASSPPVANQRPVFIVAALLLASFVVGFDTRVFSVGLPDLRGAFGLDFDEGAWFSTAANAPQILVAPAVAWIITVYGVRRVMVPLSVSYALLSLSIPLIQNQELLFAAHMLRATALGVFIPATLMIIFRNLSPEYWIVGLAIYTLRIPLSQALGFALVGFYGEDLGWQWLYWQDVALAPLIGIFLILGAPKLPIDTTLLENADWGGMLLLGASMTMLYVGLDQGNRLDWFHSGLINSVFIAGGILFVLFLANEAMVSRPWAHASVLRSRNVVLGLVAIAVYTLASSSGSTLVPGFMQTVAGMRPYQIGSLFIFYAALPAFLFVAITGVLLRCFDPRVILVLGMTATGIAALMGLRVTSDWFPESFRLPTLLNTAGQVMTFFAAFVFIVANSDPKRSTSLSAYIQVFRLGSAEVAASFMSTFLRFREQFHSNALGVHLTADTLPLRQHIGALSHLFGTGNGGSAKAIIALSSSARTQSNVLAYGDSFLSAFWFAVVGLLLVALMTRAPAGPLSPRPIVFKAQWALRCGKEPSTPAQ